MPVVIGDREYFPGVSRIPYEGRDSDNPLSFKYYDENRVVVGRTMKQFFRFATCYWHSFCGTGADPFGPGTQRREWLEGRDAMTPVSYTHLRAHETPEHLVCRLL